ncbi:urease accessory UreF family protein, partial [Streptomyces scabiei]|uniref:urease accessory UreF family protein n=1 Tax=Streptomyces scabiei TaxID=1930 RepID=UPI0029B5DBC9
MSRAALLVLADGRFPAGVRVPSGGAEAAVKAGLITGAEGLEAFCRGRLHTAGLVAAGLAAAAALGVDPADLDAAADARTPSVALRGASRKLGRQLMRAARATWPSAELDALAREFPKGAHQPVVPGLPPIPIPEPTRTLCSPYTVFCRKTKTRATRDRQPGDFPKGGHQT